MAAICTRWPAYTPDTALHADAQVLALLEAEQILTINQEPVRG